MTPRKPSNPSPLTENPDSSITPKPNSRSSEIGDPMRRSFNGNLFQKPSIVANPRGFNPVTPANSPSDWSVRGRESNTIRFLRETDEKENARDSNHLKRPAAKGMKNFMSPTVSAASKINASPCKKVLTERISHQQTPLRRSVSSVDLGSSCSSSISNLSETMEESEAGFGKELDLREPLFPSALSPYDPKTNFLAPRPKFLYYKPKEMDCNPIDCETEETESDISHESKDVVSSQAAAAKEEDVVDTGIEKERSRQLLFTKSKCILSAFILLLVACSTMMETDHFQSTRSYNSMIKESSFRSFGVIWCEFSVSYIGGLMSELRGGHRLGHVTFFNLTYLEQTQWNDKKENLIKDEFRKISEHDAQIEAEEEEESDLEKEEAVQSCIAEEEVIAMEEQKVIAMEEQKVISVVEKEKNIIEEKESELPQVEELIPTDAKIASQDSAKNRVPEIAALVALVVSLVAGCVAFKKIRSSSSSSMVSPVSGKNNLMAEFDFVGDSSLLSASSTSDMSMSGGSASPSLSYGSFTTYKMIPSKKRNGDEELVITPLRRSSRLRK